MKKKTNLNHKGEDDKYNKLEEENQELKNRLIRTLADYDNLTKRVDRERDDQSLKVKIRLISGLLPGLDILYNAVSHISDQGLSIAIQAIEEGLKSQSVEKILPKEGELFDEESHEVVDLGTEENKANGEILEVVMIGWRIIDGPVIRHAKVKVNKIEE